MKKTMLWGTLIALACTQAHSEATQPAPTVQNPDAVTSNPNQGTSNPAPAGNPSAVTPQQNTVSQPGSQPTNNAVDQQNQSAQQPATGQTNQQIEPAQQQPTTGQTTPEGQPSSQPPASGQTNPQNQPVQQPAGEQTNQQNQTMTPTAAPQTPPVIDCNYKIPADTKTIDQTLVLTWSQKAIIQAFDFNPETMDAQLQQLQACFTDQGWSSFSSALQKSGNIDAIKTQKLHVSSQVDGQAQFTETQEGQWKINIPLQVVYQNDKEKVTQLLTVTLSIGRKKTGDLGINQMIATPRTAAAAVQQNSTGNATPATDTTAPGTGTTNNTNPTTPGSTDSNTNSNSNSGTPNTTTPGQ